MPTPTAERAPTIHASQTTSRASSRTDFHIGVLPPLHALNPERSGRFPAAAALNNKMYGTARKRLTLNRQRKVHCPLIYCCRHSLAAIPSARPAPREPGAPILCSHSLILQNAQAV